MSKTDITKSNLYFVKMLNVISASIRNMTSPVYANGRHSDAFVYILSGKCDYEFDDGYSFSVKTGDILYLAYNSVYTMHIHKETYSYIFCDFEFGGDTPRKSDVYSPKNTFEAESLFHRLLKHYTSPNESYFTERLSLLYKIYGIVKITSDSCYITKSSKQKIEEAKQFVDSNLQDTSISVTLLAQKCGMSDVLFRKMFKALYNTSPSQYIIYARLKKSTELMSYPFLSLEECALQSGFSSLQYFCRVFKRSIGISPAKYRKAKNKPG